MASMTLLGGDEQHTFHPPYVPEWNEFYSRTMHFQYDRLRIEPGRIGIVIDAADHDARLSALPTGDLMEKLFDSAGLTAVPSSGGLIARQLISRVGGVQGGRVFKIPGVRRLLKTHGPAAAFTMRTALQTIGERDETRMLASTTTGTCSSSRGIRGPISRREWCSSTSSKRACSVSAPNSGVRPAG
jgi:hypothetical protein